MEELSYPSQMKVAADKLVEYVYEVCHPLQETHHLFWTTIISLTIEGARVMANLNHKSKMQSIWSLCKNVKNKKYNWGHSTWNTIDWYLFELALKHQKPGLKWFIHRFTCKWLPVGAQTKFYQKHQNSQCVSCQAEEDKSCVHIFQCSNPRRRSHFLNQVVNLMTDLQKKHTYKQIIMILQKSIIQWCKGEPFSDYHLPSHSQTYNYTIQTAIEEQKEIGWNPILKGWLSKRWAQAQEEDKLKISQ